ncbi:MAG: Uma2 family endonuclease [Burkholderiales bacterium]
MGNLAFKAMSMVQFIAWERNQAGKHEYLDGEIFAMTGGTRSHDIVRNNLVSALRPHLRNTGCQLFGPEFALRADLDRARFYPDLFVTCRRDQINELEATSAKWILEVLSPSTQGRDRVEKWSIYRAIAELTEYVLIDPAFWRIEIHRRAANGEWALPTVCKPAEKVRFESLDFETSFDVIFEDVPAPPSDEDVR